MTFRNLTRAPSARRGSVDPLRFKYNGRIYERGAILRVLHQDGRDPLTRIMATEADYVSAPVAADAARRYAQLLEPEQVFVAEA